VRRGIFSSPRLTHHRIFIYEENFMGTVNASARWTGEKLDFIGTSYKGHQIPMGGDNISPSQMLLLGLAGCTGMDVVSILQKKRQAVRDVQVQIAAHQPDEYPRPYHTI
jgi:putative redox protein